MALENKNSENQNNTANPYNVNKANIIGKSDRFEFEPITQIFDIANPQLITAQLAPDYSYNVDAMAPVINSITSQPRSNYNNPTPNYPSGNYDYINTALPGSSPNSNDNPLADILGSSSGRSDDPVQRTTGKLNAPSSLYYSKEALGFDRYYEHPKFDELGFSPFRDNEAYYNEHSNAWDDFRRMVPQFGHNMGHAFMSTYRSIGDFIQGDNYLIAPDIETSMGMERAMRIGSSTRGGVFGFANNLTLNLGYTSGILLNIAAEEAALLAATALSGGAAAPAATARTGVNLARGANALRKTFGTMSNVFTIGRGFNATRNLINTFRNTDKAIDFYNVVKAGGKFAGDFFAPETMKAIQSWNTTQNSLAAMSNLAKLNTAAGGFYRDARAINFTLAESKLEGGMTYNNTLREAMDYIREQNGNQPLTTEEMQKAHKTALEAAHKDAMLNAPVIFLSNKIVLNKALGANFSRFGRETFQEGLGKMQKRLLTEPALDAAGKVVTTPFKKAPKRSLFQVPSLKGLTKGSTYRKGAYNAMQYMAANLVEGFQETYQEAAAVGVKDYYISLLKNPTASRGDLVRESMKSGLDSQMSAEGLEVFLSGFLTGGIMNTVSQTMFSDIPNFIRSKTDPAGYKEQQAKEQKIIDGLIADANKAWSKVITDPASAFDLDAMNLSAQQQTSKDLVAAEYEGSEMRFLDQAFFSEFHHFHRLIQKGAGGQFREMIRDIQSLSDENFAEAFGINADQVSDKRKALDQSVSNLEEMQKRYDNRNNKMPNPFNPAAYKEGTEEYVEETLGAIAFENANMLFLYSRSEADNAARRMTQIIDTLASEGAITSPALEEYSQERIKKGDSLGFSFSSITTLLDPNAMRREISLIDREVESMLDEGFVVGGDNYAARKTEEKRRIQEYLDVITDPNNINPDGTIINSPSVRQKVKDKLIQYLGDRVFNTSEFYASENIDDIVTMLIDHNILNGRLKMFNQAVEMLVNPDNFYRVFEGMRRSTKDVFNSKADILRENLENTFREKKINEVLTALMELGIVVDVEDSKRFIETGDASEITNFYTQDGILTPDVDSVTFNKAIAILQNFQMMRLAEEAAIAEREQAIADQAQEQAKVNEDVSQNTADLLKDAGVQPVNLVTIEEASKGQLRYIVDLLESKYREHKANNPGNAIKTKSAWITRDGKKFIKAYYDIKQVWASELSAEDQFKLVTDQDFAQWLLTNRANDIVSSILKSYGLNFAEFYIRPESARGMLGNILASEPGVGYIQKAAVEDTYKILDKYYKPLTDEVLNKLGLQPIYDDLTKVKVDFDKYKRSVVDTTMFEYGGQKLSNGATLTHKETGQSFTVNVPNIKDVDAGLDMTVIPDDSVTDEGLFETLTIPESQMNQYALTLEDVIGVKETSENVSKLSVNEPIRVIPNLLFKGEPNSIARERLNRILNTLTQEQVDELSIQVTDVDNAGAIQGNLKWPNKEANKNINRKTQRYNIKVRVPESSISEIQSLFKNEGDNVTNLYADGTIAYIVNESVSLKGVKDPTMISAAQVSSFFNADASDVENIRNNFGIQKALINEIDARRETGGPALDIKLSEIGFSFVMTNGGFSYLPNNNTVPFQQLDIKSTEGDYLMVIDNTFGTILPSSVLQDAEEVTTNVQNALEQQGLYNSVTGEYSFKGDQLTARYIAVLKSPTSDVYTLAPLQTERLNAEETQDVINTYVERVKQTIVENNTETVDLNDLENLKAIPKSKVKDSAFNFGFNEQADSQYYITAKATTRVSLSVLNNGGLQVSAVQIDKLNKEVTDKAEVIIEPGELLQSTDPLDLISSRLFALPNTSEIFGQKNPSLIFSNNIPQDVTVEEIVNLVNTTLEPSVRSGRTMFLNAESDKIQAAKDAPTIIAASKKPSVTLEDIAENSQVAEDASQIKAKVEETTQAATQGITEYKPMDTTGREVLYLKSPNDKGSFRQFPQSFLNETHHIAKLILDKDNPNKGTLEILPSAEEILVSEWDILLLRVANIDGKSTFNPKGELINLKPGRAEKIGNIWQVTQKAEVEIIDKGGVSKVLAQQAAPVTEEVTSVSIPIRELVPVDSEERTTSSEYYSQEDIENAFSLADQARVQYDSGNTEEASRLANEANNLDPDNQTALDVLELTRPLRAASEYNFRGLRKDGDGSLEDFNKAVQLNPDDPIYYYNRGLQYEELGSLSSALADFNKAIELNPDDSDYTEAKERVSEELGRRGIVSKALTNQENIQVLLDELNTLKGDIVEFKKNIGAGLSPGKRKRLIEANAQLKAMEQQKVELENKLAGLGYKLVPQGFTKEDSVILSEFSGWLKQNLPDFISIESIDTFEDNLRRDGITAGAFNVSLNRIASGVEIEGKIYTSNISPFKYHEAFHSVFRMLLTDKQRNDLLRIAKREVLTKLKSEGTTLNIELQKFKNSAELYSTMSPERLEQEYLEEYMADEFEKFKKNPQSTKTDTEIKSFFNRIVEWIKSIFSNFTKNELKDLFEKIDSGKFKDASIQNNRVIKSLVDGITIDAYKLIRTGQREYLDSSVARGLVQSIAATYMFEEMKQKSVYNPSLLLDSVIQDFEHLYSSDNAIYDDLAVDLHDVLYDFENAFKEYKTDIKEAVKQYLNLIDIQIENRETQRDEVIDEIGGRTTDQWDLSAEMIGGYSSLSKFLRVYIATTTLQSKDILGNAYLINPSTDTNGNPIEGTGQELIVAADFANIYNGALKSMTNTSDPVTMLQKLVAFAESNDGTNAFVNRLLNDLGLSREDVKNGELSKVKDSQLFNAFISGFRNFKREHLIELYDPETGDVEYQSASNRDDISNQVNVWSQAYVYNLKEATLNPATRRKIESVLNKFNSLVSRATKSISDEDLHKQSIQLSKDIAKFIGFQFSPGYIQFSIINNLIEKTNLQQQFQNSQPNAEPIVSKTIALMQKFILEDVSGTKSDIDASNTPVDEAGVTKNILVQKNIFSKDSGMGNTIFKIARNNALFDESVGASVIKNAENKSIYIHQAPTYHLKTIARFNLPGFVQKRIANNPILKRNIFKDSPAIKAMIEGRKMLVQTVSGNKIGDVRKKYTKYTASEKLAMMFNKYLANVTIHGSLKDSLQYKVDNEVVTSAVAPVFTRVLGESQVNDMVPLPIIKAVDPKTGKITDSAITNLEGFVMSELERIIKETIEIKSEVGPTKLTLGYNAKTSVSDDNSNSVVTIDENGRAFRFVNNEFILSPEVRQVIEDTVSNMTIEQLEDLTAEQAIKEAGLTSDKVKQSIETTVDNVINEKIAELSTAAILKISTSIKSGFNNIEGITDKQRDSLRSMYNLGDVAENNLRQIVLSNFINAKSINEVLLLDQAKTLKDNIQKVKRGRGSNAAFVSTYTPIADKAKGVPNGVKSFNIFGVTEPTIESAFSGTTIDRADAQSYGTITTARHIAHGSGQLGNVKVTVLDKLQKGERIGSDRIFGVGKNLGIVSQNGMLNSIKVVGYDGQIYIKTSLFILTPELTSIDNGFRDANGNVTIDSWDPKPDREELHNIRIAMERAELETGTASILTPVSSLKMLKENIVSVDKALQSGSSLTQADAMEISAEDFGIQMVNPSNKITITDPVQIKTLITSEQDSNATVFIGGVKMTVGELIKKYHEATSNRQSLANKNLRNLMVVPETMEQAQAELMISAAAGGITTSLYTYLKYASDSLAASKSKSMLLEYFSMDGTEAKYNINNPIVYTEVKDKFLSFWKQGMREKLKGQSSALVSDLGMKVYRRVFSLDENGIPDKFEIIRSIDYSKSIDIYRRSERDPFVGLEEAIKAADGKGVVILDRLRMNLKEYDENGNFTGVRYSEILAPPHFKEVMDNVASKGGKIPDAIAKRFAVRIPSQDKHSAVNAKIVDFLPAIYGSVAVSPAELVEVAGSDFDIDKLYMQMKEFFFNKDGQVREYGKADSEKGRYIHYARYMNNEVANKKSVLSKALDAFKNNALEVVESLTDKQVKEAEEFFSKDALNAAGVLGLPRTLEEYRAYTKKFGTEPYSAPMNNDIVDAKFALLGNTGITESKTGDVPIAYQPANLKPLTNKVEDEATGEVEGLLQFLERNVPILFEKSSVKNMDADMIFAQAQVFNDLQAGAGGIGTIVKPNLGLNVLAELNYVLEKPVVIAGYEYKDFNTKFEIDPTTGKRLEGGYRTQYSVSAVITAMTDNLKEQLAGAINLKREFLPIVGTMTALGVPIKTIGLMVNTPAIREKFKDVTSLEESAIAFEALKNDVKDYKNPKEVTDQMMIDLINSDDVLDRRNLDVIVSFLQAKDASSIVGDVSTLVSLNQGFSDFNSVDRAIANTKEAKLFSKLIDDTYLSSLIKSYETARDINDEVFISELDAFKEFGTEGLFENRPLFVAKNKKAAAKFEMDKLSFLTILGYMHRLTKSTKPGSKLKLATLTNGLIYPQLNEESIIDIVSRLREQYKDKYNFFLQRYLIVNQADSAGNDTGVDLLDSNTFNKLNDSQKVDLQTGFMRLYNDPNTKGDAISILSYIMVKSGLQFEYKSILDAVAPSLLDEYFDAINDVEASLRQGGANSVEVFGQSWADVNKFFRDNYFMSASAQGMLRKVKAPYRRKGDNFFQKDVNEWANGIYAGESENKPLYVIYGTELERGISFNLYKFQEDPSNPRNGIYVLVDESLSGSYTQSPIGFMFSPVDSRPSLDDVNKFVANKRQLEGAPPIAPDFESMNAGITFASLEADIQATEDTVMVDGVDVAGAPMFDLADILTPPTTQPQAVEQPVQASMTVGYTPKGKERQTYTVQGTQIFNKDGKEVFKTASADRNKIFANLAVKQGRAKIVTHKGADYVVNDKLDIMSVKTGNIMKWGPENGDRKAIINLYQGVQPIAEPIETVDVEEIPSAPEILSTGKKTGVTIDDLNEGQKAAYNDVLEFVNDPARRTHSLIGYAGTGKTTLLNLIKESIRKDKPFLSVVFTSPTHRANSVMKLKMPDENVRTIHSLLGLAPNEKIEDFDLRTATFQQKKNTRLEKPDILIVDESSMINDDLFGLITKQFKDIKILFVGDDAQIKPVKQATKSKALTSTQKVSVLNQVMRADNVKLLNESMLVRETGDYSYESKLTTTEKGVYFTKSQQDFLQRAFDMYNSEEFKSNPLLLRVLAATNKAVADINSRIRAAKFGENAKEYMAGDIIMGYSNWKTDYDTQQPLVSNGGDYVVIGSTAATKTIYGRSYKGSNILLKNLLDPSAQEIRAFVISKDTPTEDINFLGEVYDKLASEAIALGRQGDRQGAARKWQAHAEFKESFMTPVEIKFNGRTKFTKTIDYGYAHTIHKSQGGTYNNIFVFADTINVFKDKGLKSQLRYVAVTRAESTAYILSSMQPMSDIANINNLQTEFVDSTTPLTNNQASYDSRSDFSLSDLNVEAMGVSSDFFKEVVVSTKEMTEDLWKSINVAENKEMLNKAGITTFNKFQSILNTNNLNSEQEFIEYLKKCNK